MNTSERGHLLPIRSLFLLNFNALSVTLQYLTQWPLSLVHLCAIHKGEMGQGLLSG